MPDQPVLADLRALLEEERSQLRAQLGELGVGGDGAPSFDENFADSGQVAAEQGETRMLASSLSEQLRDVESAIAKLDDGAGYGVCEVCGKVISPARLEAMPATRYCIDDA
ncbi:MAG: DnaK suppressor protein [Acidimicrobiaceae bacterium]|jgi:RNA polymerase-binding transcription factor DksA